MENKLKKYIEDNKIDVKELSKKLNLSEYYIKYIINEDQNVNFDLSIKKTKALIKCLGCEPEDILNGLQLSIYYDNIYPLNMINAISDIDRNSEDFKFIINDFDKNLKVVFKELPDAFKEKEIKVINSRFKKGKTLKECANECNVTVERIRQLENDVLFKLNKNEDVKYILIYGEELWKMQCEIRELEKKELELKKKVLLEHISELSKEKYDYLVKIDDELLKCNIDILNLSVRSYNGLRRAGIKTIEELISLDKNQIKDINALGQKSVKELIDRLDMYNIKMKYESDIKKAFKLN